MQNTALFVDDDQKLLESIRVSLHARYHVETDTNPLNAIDALRGGQRYSVIVSDYRMPGMDGISFLSRVREIYPDVPRVLLTGQADVAAVSKAVNEGELFRCLIKPCTRSELLAALDAAVRHYNLVVSERELRNRLEMVIKGTTSGTWDVDLSRNLICINEAWNDLLGDHGLTSRKVTFRLLRRLVHPEDRASATQAFLAHCTGRVDKFSTDARMRHRNGAWRWIRASGKITETDSAGKPKRISGIITDVDEELKAKQALSEQLSFLHEILDALPNPIIVQSEDMRFITLNRSYEQCFGVTRDEIVGKMVHEAGHLPMLKRLASQIPDECIIKLPEISNKEIKLIFTDDKEHNCLYSSHAFRGKDAGHGGTVRVIVDISHQKMIERRLAQQNKHLAESKAKLRHLSQTDYLTDLPNRRYCMKRLNEAISLATRHRHPLSVLMADLDHFKRINDVFGHDAGDVAIKGFARILRSLCRKEDLPARVGGEEFLAVLPMTELEEAHALGTRICETVRSSDLMDNKHTITVSIGIAQLSGSDTLASLLERADQALYRAKKQGRDQVCA